MHWMHRRTRIRGKFAYLLFIFLHISIKLKHHVFAWTITLPSVSKTELLHGKSRIGQRQRGKQKIHKLIPGEKLKLRLSDPIRRRDAFALTASASSEAPKASEIPLFDESLLADFNKIPAESNQQQQQQNEEPKSFWEAIAHLIPEELDPKRLDEFIDNLKLPRALEIRVVLLKEIIQPIVKSLVDQNNNYRRHTNDEKMTANNNNTIDWNEFWLERTGASQRTNADHVAHALEQLGVIYVKFGQLLAARVDLVPPPLANAMLALQDSMEAFDPELSQEIIRQEISPKLSEDDLEDFLTNVSPEPIAAASIGQVHKGMYRGKPVAIKVKRPGIRETIDRDAVLLRSFAAWLESWTLPGQKNRRLIAAKLVDAVEEFINRIYEELDYHREANNIQTFGDFYSIRRGNSTCGYKVLVPEVYRELCTDNVIVMEWIEGEKIENCDVDTDPALGRENLKLVERGIEFTFYQLLQDGCVHADPHLGNLRKVRYPNKNSPPILAYLDFGIITQVPERVRDGIVCAMVDLVFAQNVTAIAQLFGESNLLSGTQFRNQTERAAFEQALNDTYTALLEWEAGESPEQRQHDSDDSFIPFLRFDSLLISLSKLISRFEFTLPPYFFNNARALVTLEGVARRLDPSFNILSIAFPFAVDRLWNNPTVSHVVEDNFRRLFYSPDTDMLDINVFLDMVSAMSEVTGRRRRAVFFDFMTTRGGRRVFSHIWMDMAKAFFFDLVKRIRQYLRIGAFTFNRRSLLQKLKGLSLRRRARRRKAGVDRRITPS